MHHRDAGPATHPGRIGTVTVTGTGPLTARASAWVSGKCDSESDSGPKAGVRTVFPAREPVTASAAAAAIVCSESHPGFEPYCLPVIELRWPGGLINDKIAQAGQSPTFFQVFSQIQS